MKITDCLLDVVAASRSLLLAASRARAQGKLNVIATTEDLAAIAREVGGDRITIDSLAQRLPGSALRRGQAELHPEAAEGRSADRRRPRAGDRLAAAAHPAEPQREDPGRRRRAISTRRTHARILDIPQGQITRAMGDVHPSGNPHYWLDPENGKAIARDIAAKLVAVPARRQGVFRSAAGGFHQSSERRPEALAGGDGAVQGHQGGDLSPVVSELRRSLRPRRRRLRRAAPGHSAVAGPHARPDPGDEAAADQGHPDGAVLRSEDAQLDREPDRRQGAWCCRRRSAARRRSPTTSSCSTTTSICWCNALQEAGAKPGGRTEARSCKSTPPS